MAKRLAAAPKQPGMPKMGAALVALLVDVQPESRLLSIHSLAAAPEALSHPVPFGPADNAQ